MAPCLISLFTISAPTNSHQSSVSYCHKPGRKTFSSANHSGADNLVSQSQPRVNTCTCDEKKAKIVGLANDSGADYRVNQSEQQSQSKLLGHFTVFLPSQCWCARFGELIAINNIGRTRRRARSEKTALGGSVPTIFVRLLDSLRVTYAEKKRGKNASKSGA